ncbi:MAG: hypothetical protein FWC50_10855 [Planctomycetaceae bacterium]|nr:hypothetical protein [Planctomycetaceae bacterium]
MESNPQKDFESFLAKCQKRFEYLEEHGYTIAEYDILQRFYYRGHDPREERLIIDIYEWAHIEDDIPECRSLVTQQEIEAGLARLIREGYLVEITERKLDLIKGMCEEICKITVTGWPDVGDISLTPKGLAVLREINVSCDGDYYIGNSDMTFDYHPENNTTHIITMNKEMLETMQKNQQDAGSVEKIGPWTEHWWQIYPHGYITCIDGEPDFESI